MYHTIYYTFGSYIDFEYKIEENFEDIKDYIIYITDKDYPSNLLLPFEDKKDIVKKLKKAYYSNTLDTNYLYLFDFDFKDWIKERYRRDAFNSLVKKMEEEYYE